MDTIVSDFSGSVEELTAIVLHHWQIKSRGNRQAADIFCTNSRYTNSQYRSLRIGNYDKFLQLTPFLSVEDNNDTRWDQVTVEQLPAWVVNKFRDSAAWVPITIKFNSYISRVPAQLPTESNVNNLQTIPYTPDQKHLWDAFYERMQVRNGGHLIGQAGASDASIMAVSRKKKRVYGVVEYSDEGNHSVHLDSLLVNNEARGVGAGGMLLRAVEAAAKKRGKTSIQHETEKGSEGFYECMGYTYGGKMLKNGNAGFQVVKNPLDERVLVLITPSGQVVGSVIGGPTSSHKKVWQVVRLQVDRKHRLKGGGALLLSATERSARGTGKQYVVVYGHCSVFMRRVGGYKRLPQYGYFKKLQ